jgi:hypothetical protein
VPSVQAGACRRGGNETWFWGVSFQLTGRKSYRLRGGSGAAQGVSLGTLGHPRYWSSPPKTSIQIARTFALQGRTNQSPLFELRSSAFKLRCEPTTSPHADFLLPRCIPIKGRDLMSGDLSAEFESYRKTLRTEEDKQAFDRKIKQLLQERGVDYVDMWTV